MRRSLIVFAAKIDQRPWNALYERPATLALLPNVNGEDVCSTRGVVMDGMPIGLLDTVRGVVAVDRSARMVELTMERLAGRGPVIGADLGNLREILPDASFDLVLSSLVLHHVADLPATFREWGRLLRPGGRLVLSTHHPTHDPKSYIPQFCRANAQLASEQQLTAIPTILRRHLRANCRSVRLRPKSLSWRTDLGVGGLGPRQLGT